MIRLAVILGGNGAQSSTNAQKQGQNQTGPFKDRCHKYVFRFKGLMNLLCDALPIPP
jgi:hypothetical protein